MLVRRLMWVLLWMGVGISGPVWAARPYTVDDMLACEDIGKVRFAHSGQQLIFERYGPFDRQSDYGRTFVVGEMRSRLYSVQLDSNGEARPLFEQAEGDSYTLDGISPDDAYVTFSHLSSKGLGVGIDNQHAGVAKEADISPDVGAPIDTRWIGADRLAWMAMRTGDSPKGISVRAERVDELVKRWAAMRNGGTRTGYAIGSGRFQSLPDRGESLALVRASAQVEETLEKGKFNVWLPAPDGKSLALVREDPLVVDPNQPLEHGANIGGVQHALLIKRLSGGGPALEVCRGCDVLQSSIAWSADSRRVAFLAREPGKLWSNAGFHVYTVGEQTSHALVLPGLKPHIARAGGLFMDARAVWLGDRLIVLADALSAGKSHELARDARGDLYILEARGPRNLTGALKQTPRLIAISNRSAIVLDADEAWSVEAGGRLRSLTARLGFPVAEWRDPSPYGDIIPVYDIQPQRMLMLKRRVMSATDDQSLVFIDLKSLETYVAQAPSKQAVPVAVSEVTRSVAYLDKHSNVTDLVVIDRNGRRREIVKINAHLQDVTGGTAVRIDHKGPDGSQRMSWLLLPPGYVKGQPLPTVVNVYPGAGSHETFTHWRLDETHALNDYVLSAHGYAVLYPHIPVKYEDVPRDPMKGLVEEVFAAVDAARAAGYVDPDRLAVQGQSFGGYTTGALVGLTPRFKSAVAQAGLYDLISAYGEFDIRSRLDAEYSGLDLFAASLLETNQLGMGSAPWKDPERYLRNSPLMHVEAVTTPILLIGGDLDYVSTTQAEEFFTALTRLRKDAVMVRYYGEDHVFNSPANIRDMWQRIFDWYEKTLGPPFDVNQAGDN